MILDIKSLAKPLALTLALGVLTTQAGSAQDGFLSKVFKGNKTVTPANSEAEVNSPAPAPSQPAASQNAFRPVSSNGKIVDQAEGTKAPPRRISNKSSDGAYQPVSSSMLEPHQNLKKSAVAGPAPVQPSAPRTSAAGRFGPVSDAAYKPVSLDGSIQTGAVSSRSMTPAPAPPKVSPTTPRADDWTQQAQTELPPMPKLFDPTKPNDVPAPSTQVSAVSSVQPQQGAQQMRPIELPSYGSDPQAEAEVRKIMSENPSDVAKADQPPSPKKLNASPKPLGSGPETLANTSSTASQHSAGGDMAAQKAEFVGQVTPTEDLEDVSSSMQRFPAIELPETRKSIAEQNVDWLIDQVASQYSDTLGAINGVGVSLDVSTLPDVPSDFGSAWGPMVRNKVWNNYGTVRKSLQGVYASALEHSHQIKAFSDIPTIRETGIQEAEGAFDWTAFLEGRYSHTDEPTSSILTTGEIGRFRQDLWEGEYGVRKRLKTGAEVAVSNRLSTLDNNSQFTQPNPQTGSELVVSVTQPLLQGNGYHYNTSSIKIAKLDAKLGAAEYLRQLESYLLEVNRTYWGVYLARAGYLQRKSLVDRTKSIVGELEDRKGVDAEATASELLRAKSALAQRQASLIRSEMAIRLSEERLRALVNDPNFSLGSTNELVPTTAPILTAPREDVREVAKSAIKNRPELLQGFYQVQAAGLRRDLQKNELLPTLNLILEGTVAGLGENRNLNNAWNDQFDHGEGWLAGFTFEVPLERNFAKARHDRRRHELRQQLNTLRGTIDSVALEAIVAYRELQTSYRDMQAKYLAAVATREELKELEERLDVDAGGKGGTVGYQLQLTLDAIDRNQQSEESFLVSVVVYNTAFTALDKARGTLLRRNDVSIERSIEDGLDTLNSRIGGEQNGADAKGMYSESK